MATPWPGPHTIKQELLNQTLLTKSWWVWGRFILLQRILPGNKDHYSNNIIQHMTALSHKHCGQLKVRLRNSLISVCRMPVTAETVDCSLDDKSNILINHNSIQIIFSIPCTCLPLDRFMTDFQRSNTAVAHVLKTKGQQIMDKADKLLYISITFCTMRKSWGLSFQFFLFEATLFVPRKSNAWQREEFSFEIKIKPPHCVILSSQRLDGIMKSSFRRAG